MEIYLYLFLGIFLLLFGRHLFWVAIGAAGFFWGLELGRTLFAEHPPWMALASALGCALIGIVLALCFQRLAVFLAGMASGAMIGVHLGSWFFSSSETTGMWIAIGLGALLGGILWSLVFDWALVIVTSLLGALLVSDFFALQQGLYLLLVLGLAILGVVIQSRQIKGES